MPTNPAAHKTIKNEMKLAKAKNREGKRGKTSLSEREPHILWSIKRQPFGLIETLGLCIEKIFSHHLTPAR